MAMEVYQKKAFMEFYIQVAILYWKDLDQFCNIIQQFDNKNLFTKFLWKIPKIYSFSALG